jgi:tetratricopeptide (TPR) repeat protein
MTAGLRIFISYRSKDANEVRAVVDVLRAHGVDVWFAEYDVLSRDYDDFEAELDQQILKAIASCTHGVVFTNSSWAESEHCSHELNGLIDRFGPGSPRVIHVEMPREPLGTAIHQRLQGCPRWTHQTGEFTATAKSILQVVAPDVVFQSVPAPQSSGPTTLDLYGYRVQVDLGNYQAQPVQTQDTLGASEQGVLRRQFRGTLAGTELFLLATFVPPTRVNMRAYPDAMPASADNREHYRFLRQQATDWHVHEAQSEHGLHLFLHQGWPRLAMTYLKHDGRSLRGWQRMYILHLRTPGEGVQGELHLSFGMPFRDAPDQALRRFLRITPCLDAIAGSARYCGWSLLRRYSPVQILLAGMVLTTCLGVLGTPSCQRWWGQLADGNLAALMTTGPLSQGEAKLNAGDFSGSIPHLDHALAIDPRSDRALMLRCLARTWLGETAPAVADATRAIELRPEEPENWMARGVALCAAGELERAEADWQRLLDLVSSQAANGERVPHRNAEFQTANACAGLGLVRLGGGETAEAERLFQQALRHYPQYDFVIWGRLRPDLKNAIDQALGR